VTGFLNSDGPAPAASQKGRRSDGLIDFLTSLKQVAECELIVDSGALLISALFSSPAMGSEVRFILRG
jgi:hypothetical protein